jgi:hypothetical protein
MPFFYKGYRCFAPSFFGLLVLTKVCGALHLMKQNRNIDVKMKRQNRAIFLETRINSFYKGWQRFAPNETE